MCICMHGYILLTNEIVLISMFYNNSASSLDLAMRRGTIKNLYADKNLHNYTYVGT